MRPVMGAAQTHWNGIRHLCHPGPYEAGPAPHQCMDRKIPVQEAKHKYLAWETQDVYRLAKMRYNLLLLPELLTAWPLE